MKLRRALVLVVPCLALGGVSVIAGADPPTSLTVAPTTGFQRPIRGVTISTHGSGQEWGSAQMRPTMEQLRDLGAGWVAIHPYAAIRADGTVHVWRELDPESPPAELVRPIREAHALGLKILIKPHLAYWGSPFSWRGEIGFEDEASWARFWSGYRDWIITLATIGRDADGFVVGTELSRTLDQGERWTALIRDVRQVTDAPLTYAANWNEYETVSFWNELDAIGIQAYFPLVAAEDDPSEARVRAGWRRWAQSLAGFSRAQERPILFTELGYNHSATTAHEPWSSRTDESGESLQALCTRVALETIEREATILGSFLWKWFPEPHPVGRNFRLATPRMREVIRRAWAPRPEP